MAHNYHLIIPSHWCTEVKKNGLVYFCIVTSEEGLTNSLFWWWDRFKGLESSNMRNKKQDRVRLVSKCWRLMVTLYHMIIAIRYHTAIPKFSSRSMVTLSFHSIESSLETWRVYTTEKIQVVSEYSKKTFQQTSTNHWRFLPRFCAKTKIRVNDQVTQIQHTTHSLQRASRQEKVALLSENPHLGWHKQNCGMTRNSWK